MPLSSIYICRHGYRANWLPPPHAPNPTGIDSDPPLAPHGVDQAKELAAYIAGLEDKPQFVLSSPFYRCVETGRPIAQQLGLPIVLERGVGEWYKKGRATVPEPANYDRLHSFFPDVLANEEEWHRDNTLGVIPDLSGETDEEIFARAQLFWKRFFEVFPQKYPQIESVLIVTHAATKIALGMALIGGSDVYGTIDDKGTTLRAGACSLDKYIYEGSQWKNTMNGNCEFLEKGEEMNWTFHSKFEAGSDEDIKARNAQAKEIEADSLNRDDYEDFYVTIDIPMIGKKQNFEEPNDSGAPASRINFIKSSAYFQMTDLNHDNPLVKLSNNMGTNTEGESIDNLNVIDGKIYETQWRTLVGTDLVYDDYGELIGKVKEHLVCNQSVKFQPKVEKEEEDEKDDKEDKKNENEETENDKNENDKNVQESESNTQSNFLKRAIKLAKKKKEEGSERKEL